MSWPARTVSLKSAISFATCPETWVPTETVRTAPSEPVADTVWTRLARVTGAVR